SSGSTSALAVDEALARKLLQELDDVAADDVGRSVVLVADDRDDLVHAVAAVAELPDPLADVVEPVVAAAVDVEQHERPFDAALTVAGAGAGKAAAAAGPEPEFFSRSRFVPQTGTTFRISGPGARALPIRLIEVGDPRPRARRKGPPPEETFSLLFRGTGKAL